MKLIISNKRLIEQLLQEKKPAFKGYKKDKLYYIFSKLYTSYVTNDPDEEGVPLCAEILKKVIGNYYHNYMDYLLQNKVVKIVKGYIQGVCCSRYELNRSFIGLTEWYEVKDFSFRSRLRKLSKRDETNKYVYLKKWMPSLQLDIRSASEWAEKDKDMKLLYPELQDDGRTNGSKSDPERQYLHNMMMISYFKYNHKPFSVDKTGRRLHTVLTRSNKMLRNFMRFNEKQLVAIDLKNSQPYLLCCLFKSDFWEKKGTFNQVQRLVRGTSINSSIISTINFIISSEMTANTEFQRYRNLAETGRIYEHFEQRVSLPADVLANGKARQTVKLRMMLCLYSRNKTHSGGMKTAFKKEFPTIYKLIKVIKANDHRALAILLQRIESYLILDVICGRINEEKPSLPLYTIHDSIVTTRGNEEYVKQIIEEEMLNFIGVKPKVSFEYWDSSVVGNKHTATGIINMAA